jgi:uncharacterized protein with HEPN domain
MPPRPKPLRLADYLRHLIEAAARVQDYTAGLTEEDFRRSPLVQDAVIRNLEVVGEACRNVLRHHAEFAASHPEVPWTRPYEMRNVLTHGYFDIDLGRTWSTVQTALPPFAAQIQALLAQLDQPPPGAAPSAA